MIHWAWLLAVFVVAFLAGAWTAYYLIFKLTQLYEHVLDAVKEAVQEEKV